MPPELVLASASPRRRTLLARLRVRFDVTVTDVDETALADESPPAMVRRLAAAKAAAGAARHPDAVVLGADTTVVCAGEVLGKPVDRDDARRMLARVRGRVVEVVSGVTCVAPGAAAATLEVTSRLHVRDFGSDEADRYLATGEAAGKAGGLAVQGAAAVLIDRIEGSRTNVIGLPLLATAGLLERAGFAVHVPEDAD